MRDAAPKLFDPFFPEEGDHDEIKQKNHVQYYQRLKEFLHFVHQTCSNMEIEEFREKFGGKLPKDFPHFYKDEFKPLTEVTMPCKL